MITRKKTNDIHNEENLQRFSPLKALLLGFFSIIASRLNIESRTNHLTNPDIDTIYFTILYYYQRKLNA